MNQLQTQKDPWYVIRIQESKILDYFFAFLFAIIPIVQPLKTFLPVTWSMAILILSVPYLGLKFIAAGKLTLTNTWPIWIYCIYRILNHGTYIQELLTMMFIIAIYIALVNRLIDVNFYIDVVVFFSIVGSFFVILQTLCHYIFGFHLTILNPSLLRTQIMIELNTPHLTTGFSPGGDLYRPCAFFIEPTAVAEYCLPALFYLIVDKNTTRNIKKAIFISCGAVLSTSGLGIVVVAVLWIYYFISHMVIDGKVDIRKLENMLLLVCVFILLILFVPFIKSAIIRLFFKVDGTNSAIGGRFDAGHRFFSSLNFIDKIFGTGKQTEEFELYIAGMHNTLLTDGIIGYGLFCSVYINLAYQLKNKYSIYLLMLIILSMFANTQIVHSYIYYLIFAGLGINEYYSRIELNSSGD